jgi:hypothetical protein
MVEPPLPSFAIQRKSRAKKQHAMIAFIFRQNLCTPAPSQKSLPEIFRIGAAHRIDCAPFLGNLAVRNK